MGNDPETRQSALACLKTWVGRFSRNSKDPYLDSEIARFVLFPDAARASVVGQANPSEPAEDLPQEEEDHLLEDSSHHLASSASDEPNPAKRMDLVSIQS